MAGNPPSDWTSSMVKNEDQCRKLNGQVGTLLQTPSTSFEINLEGNDISVTQNICMYPFRPNTRKCPNGTTKINISQQVGALTNPNGIMNKDICVTSKITTINSEWSK